MVCRSLIALAWLAFAASTVVEGGDVWRRPAAELLDIGTTRGLTLSADGKSLELSRGAIVEDDGPAAGYSYLPNVEKLGDGIAIRKQLIVDDPRANETYLLVGPGGKLECLINDKSVVLEPRGKAGNNWEQYLLPPDVLQNGENDIVLSGTGQVWVARDDERPPGDSPPPNRSAKSIDGGKTWNDARLGSKDDFDGEYYVRLYFDRHVPRGEWTSPVLDLSNLDEDPVGGAPTELPLTTCQISATTDDATHVKFAVRYGSTYVPDDERWSGWQSLKSTEVVLFPAGNRFAQFRFEMSTDDPRRSPVVKEVKIESTTELPSDWTSQLRFVEAPTTRLRRSTIPFTFESADHPQLAKLREQYKLDDVVAGAQTEWEKILKLAAWSGVQWSKRTGHLGEAYPRWDALDILAKHSDGTPTGGFCQHYNLVFLQACESFGIRGRPVSLGPGDSTLAHRGGHEVVELWSNDYRKWVHVDGDAARYYVDAKLGTPLSLLELHDRQRHHLAGRPYAPVECIVLADTREPFTGLDGKPPFWELRMIPRSNFLEQPTPVPLNQGMRGWFWPGHYVWTDSEAVAARLYDHRVTARNNWDWTINLTEIRLTGTATPGELIVWLDTDTPGFAGFEAARDDSAPQPVDSSFAWKLNRGLNRLVVRSRNETGPLPPTTVAVEWNP